MIEILDVNSAKYLTVDELTKRGRYALRLLATELGIFTNSQETQAFLSLDTEAEATCLYDVLKRLRDEEARRMTQTHSTEDLAALLLIERRQRELSLAESVELRKQLIAQQMQLESSRLMCARTTNEAASLGSALRKLKNSLTAPMKSQLKKHVQPKTKKKASKSKR